MRIDSYEDEVKSKLNFGAEIRSKHRMMMTNVEEVCYGMYK